MSLPIDNHLNETNIETSLIKQALVALVDVVLILFLIRLVLIYQTPVLIYELIAPVNSTLLIFLCLIAYRLVSFFLFKGTIGMKIFNVILLNGNLEPLTKIENLLASIFILYKGVAYYNR